VEGLNDGPLAVVATVEFEEWMIGMKEL